MLKPKTLVSGGRRRGGEGEKEERARTSIAAGHDRDGRPCDGLEEVVRAGHEAETVPLGNGALRRPRRAQVAKSEVSVQVR